MGAKAENKPEVGSRQLSADDILGADDIRRERVEVPEWGGHVYVQTMTGRDRDQYEMSIVDIASGEPKYENMRAKLVARSVVDSEGHRLFTEDQVERLGEKSVAAIDRLFEKATELSRISNKDIEALGKG